MTEVPSLFPPGSPEQQLAALADALGQVAASGLELPADRLADLLARVRLEAELVVLGRVLSTDVAAGRLPGLVLAAFDRWAAQQRRRCRLAAFGAEDL